MECAWLGPREQPPDTSNDVAIEISPAGIAAIRKHGESTFPHECCGFILGKVNGEDRLTPTRWFAWLVRFILGKANGEDHRAAELLSADNSREDEARHNRFLITPDAYMRGEKAARAKGLDIIGFYHSHPDAPAEPSQYDLDHALTWYSYSYVIVSIRDGAAQDMTSWRLNEEGTAFDEETIKELA